MPNTPWPNQPPTGASGFSVARAMLGVVLLVVIVVIVFGLIFRAIVSSANQANYQDHLRSCRAQNEGRRESNHARAAVRSFMLDAAHARQAAAAQEDTPALKAIDLKAARAYRKDAAAQIALPLFDCDRVVRKP